MAIRTDFTAGEVLAAADLNDTFAAKANLASPTFTGTPAGPTAASGTNTTQLATTAFANAASGLVLVASQSFSTASSVSVNNCFSATYDNYRVVLRSIGTTDVSVSLRLRVSGTDNSGASYTTRRVIFDGTVTGTSQAATTSALVMIAGNNGGQSSIDITSPFIATPTFFSLVSTARGASDFNVNTLGGYHDQSVSYDGITLFPASGTFTGTVRVYGYKNS